MLRSVKGYENDVRSGAAKSVLESDAEGLADLLVRQLRWRRTDTSEGPVPTHQRTWATTRPTNGLGLIDKYLTHGEWPADELECKTVESQLLGACTAIGHFADAGMTTSEAQTSAVFRSIVLFLSGQG
jgi:hypothetical protein